MKKTLVIILALAMVLTLAACGGGNGSGGGTSKEPEKVEKPVSDVGVEKNIEGLNLYIPEDFIDNPYTVFTKLYFLKTCKVIAAFISKRFSVSALTFR